ncbi:MAG: cyclodeaminase/cyclohydrolase family protein [Synergistetes bacterium]|nr:cyclodeaminase/cyclohydrolase family protein [Synergistota bacterium]MCX8127233.1 cyclodeaminase/cyclohydrolase family protein [Synergistota bacterium]MDW8191881.1 cyclodeaminase/cyclohydrolase family protein [Synergistota bacterium]
MKLKESTLEGFLKELSSSSPVPGGGSVAALMGALGAALISMVSNLTLGRKGYEPFEDDIKRLLNISESLMGNLLQKVDEDAEAFNSFMSALKLPKDSEERQMALEEALKKATLLPLSVMELSFEVLKLSKELLDKGNKNAMSDVAVAAISAYAGMESAYFNVLINCLSMKDNEFRRSSKEKAQALLKVGKSIYSEVMEIVEGRLNV